MSIQIGAKLTLDQPPEIGKRAWNECTREGNREMAIKWHKDMLPDHFTRGAPAKYKHKTRSPIYLKKKRKSRKALYGGNIDNVFTGDMERQLKKMATVRTFPSRVTLTMTGPRYMTMRVFAGDRSKGYRYGKNRERTISRTAGQQPDKVAEVTTITPEQDALLVKANQDATLRRYGEWKQPRTYTT